MSEEKKIGAHRFVYHCDLSGSVLIEGPDGDAVSLPFAALRQFVLTEDPQSAGSTAARMSAFLLRLEQWDSTRVDNGPGLPSELSKELYEILGAA